MAEDETFARFQAQFELFFNQHRAEFSATRAILKSLIVALTENNPRGAEMLRSLEAVAASQFEKPLPSEASDPSERRLRELSLAEVHTFFGHPHRSPGGSGPTSAH